MGRGLVLSAGLVGGVAGAPILCVLLQEAHEALPRGAYVMRCGHGGLRPWDAVAVVRRCAGSEVVRRGSRVVRGCRVVYAGRFLEVSLLVGSPLSTIV